MPIEFLARYQIFYRSFSQPDCSERLSSAYTAVGVVIGAVSLFLQDDEGFAAFAESFGKAEPSHLAADLLSSAVIKRAVGQAPDPIGSIITLSDQKIRGIGRNRVEQCVVCCTDRPLEVSLPGPLGTGRRQQQRRMQQIVAHVKPRTFCSSGKWCRR